MVEQNYKIISEYELTSILDTHKIIIENDTFISDKIRILTKDGFYFVQEKSEKGELLLRKFFDLSEAEKLVNERMEIYEKMWDGCGCKIDYYK